MFAIVFFSSRSPLPSVVAWLRGPFYPAKRLDMPSIGTSLVAGKRRIASNGRAGGPKSARSQRQGTCPPRPFFPWPSVWSVCIPLDCHRCTVRTVSRQGGYLTRSWSRHARSSKLHIRWPRWLNCLCLCVPVCLRHPTWLHGWVAMDQHGSTIQGITGAASWTFEWYGCPIDPVLATCLLPDHDLSVTCL